MHKGMVHEKQCKHYILNIEANYVLNVLLCSVSYIYNQFQYDQGLQ